MLETEGKVEAEEGSTEARRKDDNGCTEVRNRRKSGIHVGRRLSMLTKEQQTVEQQAVELT